MPTDDEFNLKRKDRDRGRVAKSNSSEDSDSLHDEIFCKHSKNVKKE